ncbi:hypothetical protein O6H91_12G101100 [Diphasiastrum complanatum]|uniref:Uncharacterized protein n=4 Tax=Diphasiastrum complanatum TaxID=34168 RepID=A0ACC2C5B8_DIPCM|nr:hypothetical protein O6H91_12G101100 [Diphasiastrum complanatum]KAJ7537166.1 hypothetical protein O6H91_12G101100 [Diphasiastrum complanatum]KAJ7537167.1 hypothetical protein O6H91_12G101100 [Diphasiastrum complanatum]KAJ7537168.1 hypothetical protein O6H91_12G101100 [Diphasiastrum complanatum]
MDGYVKKRADVIEEAKRSLTQGFAHIFAMWQGKGQKRLNGTTKDLQMSVPALFLCPISLDIMEDPVTVCTGQTYDRASIEKWLQEGHRTCPITMLPLHDLSVIPNVTVQRLIQSWRTENENEGAGSSPLESSFLPKPAVHKEHILFLLKRIARSHNVKSAVRNLRLLAREDENRGGIVEAGGTLLLVSLLSEEHEECDVCEDVLSLLAVLCRSSGEARATVTEPQTVAWVVLHLQRGSTAIKLNAAALLKTLFSNEEIRKTVGRIPGFLQGLARLLKQDISPGAVKALVKMLRSLCSSRANRVKAVEAGTLRILVDRLATATTTVMEDILATMELLCTTAEGQADACMYDLTVPAVLRLVLGFSKQCTEHAIGVLLLICQSGPVEVLQVAAEAGARRQLLLLLQSDCTALAKRKALDLLRLFHAIFKGDNEAPEVESKSIEF